LWHQLSVVIGRAETGVSSISCPRCIIVGTASVLIGKAHIRWLLFFENDPDNCKLRA